MRSQVRLLLGAAENREETAGTAVTAKPRRQDASTTEILAAREWKHIYWHALSRRFRVIKGANTYGAASTLEGAIELATHELQMTREELRQPGEAVVEPTASAIARLARQAGLTDANVARSWSQFIFCTQVYQGAVPTDLQDLAERRQRTPPRRDAHQPHGTECSRNDPNGGRPS